jgi:hypothetical protein
MVAVSTLYELILGLVLLFVPWSRIWQENWLFWTLGWSQSWLMTGPVKGAVSGLGAAFLVSAASRLLRVPLVDESDPRSFS